MEAADTRRPRNFITLGNDLDPESSPAIAAAQHRQYAGNRHCRHADIEQEVASLHEQSRSRLLHGPDTLLRDPYNARNDQRQQQRTDGNVPGDKRLADPMLTIGDPVEYF